MKKIALLLALTLILSIPSFASSYGKVSIWGKVSTPKTDSVEGFDLGIIQTKTKTNTGYQLAMIGISEEVTGTQACFFL